MGGARAGLPFTSIACKMHNHSTVLEYNSTYFETVRYGTAVEELAVTNEARIITYDCTLRDGEQGAGISFSLEDKLAIVSRLDAFGIDVI